MIAMVIIIVICSLIRLKTCVLILNELLERIIRLILLLN